MESLEISFFVDEKPPDGHTPVVFFELQQSTLSINSKKTFFFGDLDQMSDWEEKTIQNRKSRHSKSRKVIE